MSNLEVQRLLKRFGTKTVVDQISFHVNDGEFFVLLGPSGGGKTTTLRMICGLEPPDGGRILIGGQDVTRLSPRQRNLGMVFQDYGLYPTMDVYGNIAYGLENHHVPKHEIQKRVHHAAEMLGLTPLLKRSIGTLSGGEQQRVALARSLAKDADVFLYDEPLANLDPKLRYQARRDIITVHRSKQKPSVYVTHDQMEAFAIADRVAVIAFGHLQQVGTPDELIEAPSNMFMARFVGTPPMNLLSGTATRQEKHFVVQVEDTTFVLPRKWTPILEHRGTSQLVLGIQPHKIAPQWQNSPSDEETSSIAAEIVDVEALIGEVIVTLKLSDHATLVAVWPETDTLPTIGDNLHIFIDPETFCLFDPDTEQSIQEGM